MKKLIFVRNGEKDFKQVYRKIKNKYKVNEKLGIGDYVYNVDNCIYTKGYKQAIEYVENHLVEWHITSYPSVLNNDIWWNEEENKWDIYLLENEKLIPIQDFTDKWLRRAHNIELVYLNGGLENK